MMMVVGIVISFGLVETYDKKQAGVVSADELAISH